MTHDRMQSALRNLSRAELRALADRCGTARAILEDFFEANVKPDADVLAKLTEWFADHELRMMLSDPTRVRMLGDLLPIDGVAAFTAGTADLPAEVKARLRKYLAHGGPAPKRGDVRPAMTASAQNDPATRRKGELLASFKALPVAEQERLLLLANEFEPA